MNLATYARTVTALSVMAPAGVLSLWIAPRGYCYLISLGVVVLAVVIFLSVFFVAVVLKRVQCPLCGSRGELGSPPGSGRRYTAFCCPQCGWIDSKGFFSRTFYAMESDSGRPQKPDDSRLASRADTWRKPKEPQRRGLRLEVENGQVLENPSANDIAIAIAGMKSDGNAFAILSRDEMFYMQISGDPTGGFDIEYQEGSTKEHFRAEGDPFPMQQIVPAMQDYAAGGAEWQKRFTWKRLW